MLSKPCLRGDLTFRKLSYCSLPVSINECAFTAIGSLLFHFLNFRIGLCKKFYVGLQVFKLGVDTSI